MNLIKITLLFWVVFIMPQKVFAYCYGSVIDGNIIEKPAQTGDYFNEFHSSDVLSIIAGEAHYWEWSDRVGYAPQNFYITVPDKITLHSSKGRDVNLTVKIDHGYEKVNGYSSATVGYLGDAHCAIRQGEYAGPGRYQGGNISITMSGNGVPSGIYTGKIPYYYTYSDTSDENSHWTNFLTKLKPKGATGYISVSVTAQNNCSIDTDYVDLDYGTVKSNSINGMEVGKTVTFSCKNTALMNYSIKGIGGDTDNYSACGTGGVCILSVVHGGNKTSSGQFVVQAGIPYELRVNSEFKVKGILENGPFKGNGILILKME
ncbi:hypothetical protein QG78_004477 [Salmonella enterica subsp. enterica]|nr:hypothetical protein [Salmonella enterica subsp. enterica serovar Bredeney]EEJ8785204.1 hypothetical protein [Salmonella enterica subsp. enterica]EGX5979043.1 hypothetical protein [Salmonella enterica]